MKTLLLVLCGLAAAAATPEWEDFKTKFGKSYANPIEEAHRMSIFLDKVKYIEEFNKLYEKGEKSYYLKINQHSDLTHEELIAMLTGGMERTKTFSEPPKEVSVEGLASEVDWRTKGAVNSIKDQGQCGSCWAFSAVSALESAYFIKHGSLPILSEQNLVDCAGSKHSCYGCGGGWPWGSYEYIIENGGIDTEAAYPYHARDQNCQYDPSQSGATVSTYVEPASGSESELQTAVHDVGPVSVCIDAGQSSFGSYGGGVYDEPNCSSTYSNHAVTVVGYGVDGGKEYWLVRNSWGDWWGESGYIRMSRNKSNQCAIATYSVYPVVG